MSEDGPVLYDVAEGIGTVTLNRPEAMNSLDIATKERLKAVLQEAAADESVRCVVVTGAGRAFCVGQDLKEHAGLLEAGDDDALSGTVRRHYAPIAQALAEMPKPVVASVNGVAAGAGASIAFACDFRVVADSAGFNLAFAGVALSCDTGISWTLPRLVGTAKATELLYFPRTIPADEALELGLASSVVPASELAGATADLAGKLAAGPTVAYGGIRQSIGYSATHLFGESLEFEAGQMALTGQTEDHRNAVASFLAKQKPVYTGR